MNDPDYTFAELVEALRTGRRIPADVIRKALAREGRTADALIEAAFGNVAAVQPGDSCELCGGPIVVYSTHRKGDYRIRYLCCCECRHRPLGNKQVVPVRSIRR